MSRRRIVISLMLMFILILVGCGDESSVTEENPANAVPSAVTGSPESEDEPNQDSAIVASAEDGENDDLVAVRWEAAEGDESSLWTSQTYEAIDEHGLNLLEVIPVDVQEFCPNYPQLSREFKKNFWAYFLSSISELESGHKPEIEYRERFRNSFGARVISRGLLQLSSESALGYGCEFSSEEELHNPELNLSCGVRILDRWVGRDQTISGREGGSWQGGARYWSVLRDRRKLELIKSWTQQLEFCK